MFKQLLKRGLIACGAPRHASRFAGKGAVILMYHSVQDDPAASFDPLGDIAHSTCVFRKQMEIIARNFSPVTLEHILGFVNGDKDLPSRSVVVTFDDGYADNYHVAKPLLDKFGIPGVFYITVDSVDRQTLPWPALLRHSFLASEASVWPEPGAQPWPLKTRKERLGAFEKACSHCARLSGKAQQEFLDQVSRELVAPPLAQNTRPMMTWDEIRSLDRSGHTVGSHTMTHPNMAQVTPAEAEMEFSHSKRRLEQELAKRVTHFSYPCPALEPHWASYTVAMSREIGYLTGVTTNGGMVRISDDSLKLRRIGPTETIDGLQWSLERAFCGLGA